MKLGAFFYLPGHHVASWKHPSTDVKNTWTLPFLTQLAQTAERGKFDNIFFADFFGEEVHGHSLSGLKLDPLIVLAAIAAVTNHIGLVATATTTYNEPFHIARKYAALDHISNGRAAWNVVTSGNEGEALLFGKKQHLHHARRYERAEEFVDVVKQLWHSIDAEALVVEKEKGRIYDMSKVNKINHQGEFFQVSGYLDTTSTPQGHPVIVQAGSSEAGKELAAKTAEVIFTAWQTLEDAQRFYADVKGRLAKYGRHEDELIVMPGVFITVAKTEEEARRKQKELNGYISPEVGLAYISKFALVDVTHLDPDSPIPNFGEHETDPSNPNTRPKIIREIVEREGLKTLRELYEHIAGARGHREIVGTPSQIADQLQEWFENGAADG